MRRGFLIVLLSAGAIFGFASGIHSLRYGHHWYGHGWGGHACCNGAAASQPTCGHP